MPKTFVSKTIAINAPKEKVKQKVNDFHHWVPWSPWLVCEPDAQLNIDDNGKFYSWEGKRVGSGNMKVTKETEDTIEYDLNFLKPWKSHAKVAFNLKENQGNTEAEWTMASSLPFFMFWMKKKMEAYIGMDYDRGLKMLKEYVETDHINSKLEFKGTHDFEGCDYIGIHRTTNFDRIGTDMQADFQKLGKLIGDENLDVSGVPFSQYHKFDMVTGNVEYTSAFPVKSMPESLDNEFVTGHLPATKMNTVRHYGPYDHVGNAWSASMMMLRNKEFKGKKKYHPIEFYINDPTNTAPSDLISEVSFAVK